MKRRWRVVVAKPGELKVQYGKLSHDPTPDVCFAWGEGCNSADSRLLDYFFVRCMLDDNNLLNELAERGYDITTMKFSIQKKTHK